MIELDVAGLVVIAGRVLGIGTDAALSQLDIAAAESALAEARLAGPEAASAATSHRPGIRPPGDKARGHAAAGAAVALMHALLRYPPFPGHGEQVAVAAGLQFLSLNGWRADLDPPEAAAVVVEALAAGQLSAAGAAAWLAPRLSPRFPARLSPRFPERWSARASRVPALLRAVPVAGLSLSRMLAVAVLTIAIGGLAMLATACSRGPAPAQPSTNCVHSCQTTVTAPAHRGGG